MSEMTLDLENDYRAHVVHDEFAEKPYDEFSAPVVSVDFARGYVNRVQGVNSAGEDYSDYIDRFVDHYGGDWQLIARTLKIVFGATTVEQFDTRNATYFVFDPQDWTAPGDDNEMRPEWVKATTKEFEAWANGECYGVVVEEKRTGTKVYDNGTREDFTEWVEVDSVWGFYGDWVFDEENLKEIALDFVPSTQ